MATVALQDRLQDHPALGFVDWVLRGIEQFIFQNNPISGAVILVGIFYNSWICGTVCLVGTIISTLTALLLRADKGMIKDGLFGLKLTSRPIRARTSRRKPPRKSTRWTPTMRPKSSASRWVSMRIWSIFPIRSSPTRTRAS